MDNQTQLALPKQIITDLTFTQDDLFLLPINKELQYKRRKNEEKTSISHGQRKLLLGEIEFLTFFWNPEKVPNPILIVAGGACGQHYNLLEMLFPEIKEIHLYDTKPFTVEKSDKIVLHNEYFTNITADQWKDRNDIFFISDIRSVSYLETKTEEENEDGIIKDMEAQSRWFKIIKPVHALLKFRLAYPINPKYYTFKYLNGHVLIQCYPPQTSTETRLVPTSDEEIVWDCRKYERQMFFINSVMREKYQYINPYTQDMTPLDGEELQNDFDSRCEFEILSLYFKKRGINNDIYEEIKSLSRRITENLNKNKQIKDTLAYLRLNPRIIKERNMKSIIKSRDDNTCILKFNKRNKKKIIVKRRNK